MIKRIFDIAMSLLALIVLLPLFVIVAFIIKLTSKGTIFYLAKRAGLHNEEFKLVKFRSMHMNSDSQSSITLVNDNRVFWFGKLIRATKIDELPQLYNVLVGDMSIIGPRPEDVSIVNDYYTDEEMLTLNVRPGMSSPGSLYNYTHGHLFLDDNNVEKSYVDNFLHRKLELEIYYVKNQNFWYDIQIIFRTVYVIILKILGVNKFDNPNEIMNK